MSPDAADLGAKLVALATDEGADRTRKHFRPLRGVRGVAPADLSKLVSEVVRGSGADGPIRLPRDEALLSDLFSTAWEDGLLAIGLLATAASESPAEALALALDWAERTDDVATADALGWLVVGPAVAASGLIALDAVLELRGHERPETRRVAVASGLAWTPEPLEGPAAAGLRERFDSARIRMVDQPVEALLAPLCSRFARDEVPPVQKAMRRLLRAWADAEPGQVVAWAATVRGGLPKLLGAVVDEARRRSR